MEINTTGIDRSFSYLDVNDVAQTVTVSAGLRLAVEGKLSVSDDFELLGEFELGITTEETSIKAVATMTVLDTEMSVTGVITIFTGLNFGIAAALDVSLTSQIGVLEDNGVALSGSFMAEINTTGIDRDLTYFDSEGVEQTRTVGFGLNLVIEGSLNVGNAFTLYGKFEFGLTAVLEAGGELSIKAVATMDILGTEVSVSGFLKLNTILVPNPLTPVPPLVPWTFITVMLNVSPTSNIGVLEDNGVRISGNFRVEFSTNPLDQEVAYFDSNGDEQTATISAGFRFVVEGDLNVANEFTLYGKFEISLGFSLEDGVNFSIKAVATMDVLGTEVSVSGSISLNTYLVPIIVGYGFVPVTFVTVVLNVSLTSNIGVLEDNGVYLSGNFRVEFSTNPLDQEMTYFDSNGDEQTTEVEFGFRLVVEGDLNVANEFTLCGKFEVILSADILITSITIRAVATMTILETEVSVSGFIKYVPVSPLTFVTVVLEVSLPTPISILEDNGITLSGSFRLEFRQSYFGSGCRLFRLSW